jgi:hypothetical protein
LHSIFYIDKECKSLKGDKLINLQNRMKNVKLLIIDEYSTVGCILLGQVDKRMREATGFNHILFGNCSVILSGQYKQIPPVADACLWSSPGSSDNTNIKINKNKKLKNLFSL